MLSGYGLGSVHRTNLSKKGTGGRDRRRYEPALRAVNIARNFGGDLQGVKSWQIS